MRLLNPAGLWLLLGVIVLILIYLIKSRHEDRPVSSTYIWKLSSRFLKKRLPMQRLRKFLLFLLQLLMIVCTALMAARPAIITGQSKEYIAIIDGSASMQTKDHSGVSRFDRALQQVQKLSDCIDRGHRLSVILAADNASFLLQSGDTVGGVRLALDKAVCGYGDCDITEALSLANPICNRSDAKVYFYTDRVYAKTENISLVNLNKHEWNVSVDALTIQSTEEGGEYLEGIVTSHHKSVTFNVGLRADGVLKTAKSVICPKDTPTKVAFSLDKPEQYETFEIFLDEQDGLQADNAYTLCAGHQRNYRVLLASQSPLYLQSALSALGNCLVNTVSQVDDQLSGYDLYIFDGLYPSHYPTDGSVIQFGTQTLPEGLEAAEPITTDIRLSKADNAPEDFTRELSLFDTTMSQYTPLSGSAQWEPLLQCGNKTVGATTDLGAGLRISVMGFDLHESNLPMQTDYMVFMRNLVDMSVFDLLSATDFTVGQTVSVSVLPASQQLSVALPDGSVKELSIENTSSTFVPQSVGLHTAVVTTADGSDYADFFVHIAADEVLCEDGQSLFVTPGQNVASSQDAITEIWFYLALVLLVLMLLEWGVYHSEQY